MTHLGMHDLVGSTDDFKIRPPDLVKSSWYHWFQGEDGTVTIKLQLLTVGTMGDNPPKHTEL